MKEAAANSEPVADPVPLAVEAASRWAERAPPPPRDWIIPDILPAARVASMLGNGGLGKTQIGLQLAVHTAVSRALWGHRVAGGTVLGIFCEDEPDELERRVRTTCEAEGIDLGTLDNLYLLSRDGHDNLLCTFEREQIVLTPFHGELAAAVELLRPRLTILDTAADLFGGDFMSTPQVRQFLKVGLGSLAVRHATAVLLLAHPSASGMNSGDGGGFSTAWHNGVRSRLFLRRPKSDDAEAVRDRRVIELRKANYAGDGLMIPLTWQAGRFVLDPEPLNEGETGAGRRAKKPNTRLSLAVMAYFDEHAAAGQVVAFGAVFEALQKAGHVGTGDYETARKRVQRTLKQLVDEGLLRISQVPRGYRIGLEGGE